MHPSWTGGQYSLVRAVFGVYMAGALLAVAWAEPTHVIAVASLGLVLCIPLVLGSYAHLAIAGLLGVWVLLHLFVPERLILAVFHRWSWLVFGLLAAHFFVPSGPYGSLAARGRTDPDGGWAMPLWLVVVLWFGLGGYYLGHGAALLSDEAWRLGEGLFGHPQEAAGPTWELPAGELMQRVMTWALLGVWLAFVPLAAVRRTRPVAWGLGLGSAVLILLPVGYPGLALGLAMVHLLTFQPHWLPARPPAEPETLFYDGTCGLCHRAVRFVLAEDRTGQFFVIAPLEGQLFRETIPVLEREALPDSVVVRTEKGELVTRSAATLHILDRLGGYWRVVGWLGRCVPRPVRDTAYNGIARVRRGLFREPEQACPLMPPELRGRFRA